MFVYELIALGCQAGGSWTAAAHLNSEPGNWLPQWKLHLENVNVNVNVVNVSWMICVSVRVRVREWMRSLTSKWIAYFDIY